jgi:hypothetical protein
MHHVNTTTSGQRPFWLRLIKFLIWVLFLPMAAIMVGTSLYVVYVLLAFVFAGH